MCWEKNTQIKQQKIVKYALLMVFLLITQLSSFSCLIAIPHFKKFLVFIFDHLHIFFFSIACSAIRVFLDNTSWFWSSLEYLLVIWARLSIRWSVRQVEMLHVIRLCEFFPLTLFCFLQIPSAFHLSGVLW